MKMIFIEEGTTTAKVVDIQNDLHTYYNLLNCDCIDMTRLVGIDTIYQDQDFCIICDDSGLLKGRKETFVTHINYNTKQRIFGSLLICKTGIMGETGSLENEDIKIINSFLKYHSNIRRFENYEKTS